MFSVAKATLQSPMSYSGAVILKQRCGYIQNGVVISHMVRLYSKRCGYIAQNPFQHSLKSTFTTILHTILITIFTTILTTITHTTPSVTPPTPPLSPSPTLPPSLQPELASFIFVTSKTFCLVTGLYQIFVLYLDF